MNIHKEGKGILTKLFAVIMMFNAAAFLFFGILIHQKF